MSFPSPNSPHVSVTFPNSDLDPPQETKEIYNVSIIGRDATVATYIVQPQQSGSFNTINTRQKEILLNVLNSRIAFLGKLIPGLLGFLTVVTFMGVLVVIIYERNADAGSVKTIAGIYLMLYLIGLVGYIVGMVGVRKKTVGAVKFFMWFCCLFLVFECVSLIVVGVKGYYPYMAPLGVSIAIKGYVMMKSKVYANVLTGKRLK